MEASNTEQSFRAAVNDSLGFLAQAAEREQEVEEILTPDPKAARTHFETLMDVVATAIIATSQAEAGIQRLLSEVAENEHQKPPVIRFEHPRDRRPGWTVTAPSREQDELLNLAEQLRAVRGNQ